MKKVNFNPKCKYKLLRIVENKCFEDNNLVYNIEVANDHSYLVDGLVVKNCRCRYVRLNPLNQYIENGNIRMKAMDEKAWEKWYNSDIITKLTALKQHGIEL